MQRQVLILSNDSVAFFIKLFGFPRRSISSSYILFEMSHYVNPLHPSVHAGNTSSYSTLGSANHMSSPAASTFLIPNRRRLAQTPYTPSGKWKSTSGRMQPLHNPIAFDLKGYSKQGFPMQELCIRGEYALEQMMQGATDQVLAHAPYLRKITIHIRVSSLTPSYLPYSNSHELIIVAWL